MNADERRLDLMRHWAESETFTPYPWVRELLTEVDRLTAERDAALAERDALRAAMQGLEWQELPTASGKTNWFCPLCLRPRDGRVLYQSTERTVTTTHGHTDRCAMAAALGAPAAGQGE